MDHLQMQLALFSPFWKVSGEQQEQEQPLTNY